MTSTAVPRASQLGNGGLTTVDDGCQLLIPAEDTKAPRFSIVIPAMDENVTIATFVDWCKEGIRNAGVDAEILIVDSSTDETPAIALAHGARVLKTPKRGLGRAYIDAIPYIRGDYVIMGDADCTYDFRDIAGFVARANDDFEFVMGSRLKGYIEPKSMPIHHRYFGTPLTTHILNILLSSHFSDIHCGMRMVSKDALLRMNLQAQSWEYASEMIIKSVHLGLRTAEVPVGFFRDPDGRESHLKRIGWTAPFSAGWISLKIMFVSGADFFLFRPGLAALIVGLIVTLLTTFGPITLGPITFSLFWKLAGSGLVVLGLQGVFLGLLARVFYDYDGSITESLLRRFRYTRTVIVSAILGVVGFLLVVPLVVEYVRLGFALDELGPADFLAVSGLVCIIVSFGLFTFMLLLHAAASFTRRR